MIIVTPHPQLLKQPIITYTDSDAASGVYTCLILRMKKLCYITIFYSHTESYKHLYGIHMKKQKRESVFQHRSRCPVTLLSPVGNRVCSNPDAVSCHHTQHVFADSMRLASTCVVTPFHI